MCDFLFFSFFLKCYWVVHKQCNKAHLQSSQLEVQGVGGDCFCFSAAHLAKGEALPASVG